MNPRYLDHAVRMGLISAGFIGTSIGILYGLTHSAQIGVVLTDAIDLYGNSSGVGFNTGSPVIASMVSIIPAVIGAEAKPLRGGPNFFLGRPEMQHHRTLRYCPGRGTPGPRRGHRTCPEQEAGL